MCRETSSCCASSYSSGFLVSGHDRNCSQAGSNYARRREGEERSWSAVAWQYSLHVQRHTFWSGSALVAAVPCGVVWPDSRRRPTNTSRRYAIMRWKLRGRDLCSTPSTTCVLVPCFLRVFRYLCYRLCLCHHFLFVAFLFVLLVLSFVPVTQPFSSNDVISRRECSEQLDATRRRTGGGRSGAKWRRRRCWCWAPASWASAAPSCCRRPATPSTSGPRICRRTPPPTRHAAPCGSRVSSIATYGLTRPTTASLWTPCAGRGVLDAVPRLSAVQGRALGPRDAALLPRAAAAGPALGRHSGTLRAPLKEGDRHDPA